MVESEDSQKTLGLLKSIVDDQMELLRLSLYVATQGPAVYCEESLLCQLSDAKRETSQIVAMAAGQSVATLLKCSNWEGIAVRDLYPIGRSVVESFVNAAYIVVESEEVAERAVRWVEYRSWKENNREVGSGEFKLDISTEPSASMPSKFVEFSGKGACREWSTLDLPSRIRRVGELGGRKAGSRLLAAYALTYSISSEVIHGSPFGVNYFYQAHRIGEEVQDFRNASHHQLNNILFDVMHAMGGYLSAFFFAHGMKAPFLAEQRIFNRLLAVMDIEPIELEQLTGLSKPG
jgi:hypothetical protein